MLNLKIQGMSLSLIRFCFVISFVSGSNHAWARFNNNSDLGLSISTARVDDEFSCPLFENRPFDKLNESISSLSAVVQNIPATCKDQKSSFGLIQDNNKKIQDSVKALQGLYEGSPESLLNNVDSFEANLNTAIQGITTIGQVFSNNDLLKSDCGRQVMSTGQVLLSINEILNSLSPYALMLATLNPAAGTATKLALMGGVFTTSTISAISKMIEEGSYNMRVDGQRKAVLQNTCQYTKIARKVRYLQLARTGRIAEITKDLENNVKAYKLKFSKKNATLSKMIMQQTEQANTYKKVTQNISSDQVAINDLEKQISESKNDPGSICYTALALAEQANSEKGFPSPVLKNLEQVAEMTKSSTKVPVFTKKMSYLNIQKSLQLLAVKINSSVNSNLIQDCATLGKSWFTTIHQMSQLSMDLVLADQKAKEAELMKNEEFRQWKLQTVKIKKEQETTDQLSKVLQELAKDNSVIDRSELSQRMELLRAALFGVKGSMSLGKSPIYSWLSYTAALHQSSVGAFIANFDRISSGSYGMMASAQNQSHSKSPAKLDQQFYQDMQLQKKLGNLNLAEIPMGSAGHTKLCRDLEEAWTHWSEAIDHLGAIEFMCDIIDPYVSSQAETGIINTCRDEIKYDGTILRMSEIKKMKARLTTAKYNNMSLKSQVELISTKMNDLECPMPSAPSGE